MQPKNLGWKFAFVGLLVALSIFALFTKELRQGLDLKGGYILTFEVRLEGKEGREVVQEVIKVLKRRIDPTGTASLEWRPVGNNRFEVRMPMGTEEARQAKELYLASLEVIEAGNVKRSQIERVQLGRKRIEEVASAEPVRAAMRKMLQAYRRRTQAEKALADLRAKGDAAPEALRKAQDVYDDAAAEHEQAIVAVLAGNISVEALQHTLALYVPSAEAENMPRKRLEARRKDLDDQLARLRSRHGARQKEIDRAISAYKQWTEKRTGLDDPADLKRLVARAGVLEFRIGATLPGGQRGTELTDDQHQRYLEQLAEEGPLAGRSRNEPYQWFGLYGSGERLSPDLVVGKYAGKKYVLLYNQAGFTMLQRGEEDSWELTARQTLDKINRPAIGFKLDPRGAKLMGLMTSANKDRYMAILLDDQLYSAPVIKATIYDDGIIEGEFTYREVNELVRTLNAGALKTRINRNPVSEKHIMPSMGRDNREAGMRAAVWGLILVAAFMLVYYLYAGGIADVALMLNLILVLGAMSFIEAVFTLPGIAGVILTIGMAVDANVLIFERLREEQAKTQSMRMALRNAYSNAASAILDGNATTLITCLILGWVGTEEVRGFAITLGLGVMFSLFTSLAVTRWIFQLLVETRLVKDRIRMVAFIGTPNIKWMAKRRIFWTISVVLVAVGLVSLSTQGADVLGLEFSSGSQAVFSFKPATLVPDADGQEVLPERGQIQAVLKAKALELAGQAKDESRAEQLTRTAETAKVETLINRRKIDETLDRFDENDDKVITRAEWAAGRGDGAFFTHLDADGDGKLTRAELAKALPERTYQVATTVADVDLLREVVQAAFPGRLEMSTRVQFKLQTSGAVGALKIALDETRAGKTHISGELADKVPPQLRDTFIDMIGGVMFVVTDLKPALSERDAADRIRNMRTQPDFEGQGFNRTVVIGLKAAPASDGYQSLAVLVVNPGIDYYGNQTEWKDFADNELALLTAALQRQKSMESLVEFDAAIAGEATWRAGFAFVLSWAAIILYLWLRFGSARWGLAAVICLVHDVLIAIGMVTLTSYIAGTLLGRILLVDLAFKIDMAVVAAFLTIIGYSVNDTIVVFDRIRENRGKLAAVNEVIIDRSINQTISRTLLTTFTTLIAVVTMYVAGGPGIRPFTYALLVGIVFGTYSSIAIASPLLLGFKQALMGKVVGPAKSGS